MPARIVGDAVAVLPNDKIAVIGAGSGDTPIGVDRYTPTVGRTRFRRGRARRALPGIQSLDNFLAAYSVFALPSGKLLDLRRCLSSGNAPARRARRRRVASDTTSASMMPASLDETFGDGGRSISPCNRRWRDLPWLWRSASNDQLVTPARPISTHLRPGGSFDAGQHPAQGVFNDIGAWPSCPTTRSCSAANSIRPRRPWPAPPQRQRHARQHLRHQDGLMTELPQADTAKSLILLTAAGSVTAWLFRSSSTELNPARSSSTPLRRQNGFSERSSDPSASERIPRASACDHDPTGAI